MTPENMRIKIFFLLVLALFCLGAQSLRERIVFSEVKISENGQARKIKIFTAARGFDTYYHLKGICAAYDISFSYVPAKKRVLLSRGVNSLRLTVGAESKLKDFYIFSENKYFLSPEGLNYIFASLLKGSVKADKKNKLLIVSYETPNKPAETAKKTRPKTEKPEPPGLNIRSVPVLKGEKFKVDRIVIDAGHGGKDPGAVSKSGLQEKQITLELALLTAKMIKESLKKEVVLTRTKDEYISLQERSAIANSGKGDIFVSIHINASTDREATGTEVYIYNTEPTDKKSGGLALRENMEYAKTGGVSSILSELSSKSNDYLSILLAGNILDNVTGYADVESRNKNMILRAPFYVIAHANMPAVLLEVAFITNPAEEKKLRESEFKNSIAKAVTFGLADFISATSAPETEIAPTVSVKLPAEETKEGSKEQ